MNESTDREFLKRPRITANMTVRELTTLWEGSSLAARRLASACAIASSWQGGEYRVILTVSGPMSVAQLGWVVADLVRKRLLHAIVATGAFVTHAISSEAGGMYRRVRADDVDSELAARGENRIFDVIETDANLRRVGSIVEGALTEAELDRFSAAELIEQIGRSKDLHPDGLLRTACREGVPIFVPALSDCELGLSAWTWSRERGRGPYDAFRDLDQYRDFVLGGKRFAMLTLGGGVPRNWAQQMFSEVSSHAGASYVGLDSAVRICPDRVDLGHMSGSTYSEAVSWRKIVNYRRECFEEVPLDATIAFPVVASAMLDTLALHP